MKFWLVAVAYGLWLFGIEEVFYYASGQDANALQYVVTAGVIPAGLQLALLGVETVGLVAPARLGAGLLLMILLSFLGYAATDWTPLIYWCDVLFILSIALLVAGSPDPRLLRALAIVFSIPTGIHLLYVNIYGEYLFGRLSDHDLQPNYWGMIGLTVAITALASRRLPIIGFGLFVAFLTIYDASARGSLMGFASALLVCVLISLRDIRGYRLFVALMGTGAVLATLIVVEPQLATMVKSVANDLLKLDDPYRGIGSGVTGRAEAWQATLDLWETSPLFGVGYHQTEGAHNAYLATLSDMGPIGLLIFVSLLGWGFIAAVPIADARTRRLICAMLVAYAIYGSVEGRAFNMGNPFSLIFLMCSFYALAHQQRRWALARLRKAASIMSEPGVRGPLPS